MVAHVTILSRIDMQLYENGGVVEQPLHGDQTVKKITSTIPVDIYLNDTTPLLRSLAHRIHYKSKMKQCSIILSKLIFAVRTIVSTFLVS